jgi:hypothetical protein
VRVKSMEQSHDCFWIFDVATLTVGSEFVHFFRLVGIKYGEIGKILLGESGIA